PAVTAQVMERVLGVELPAEAATYLRPTGLPVQLAQGVFGLDALGLLPRLAWLAQNQPQLPEREAAAIPALLHWASACFHLHLKATAYAIGAFGLLSQLAARRLPADGSPALSQILFGQEDIQTAAQGLSLWRLAEKVQGDPALLSFVQSSAGWTEVSQQAACLEGGDQFLQEFAAFLAANGDRAAGEFELAVPRWREDPTYVLEVLRINLASMQAGNLQGATTFHQERQAALMEIQSALQPAERWAFNRWLASYRRYATLRENVKYRLIQGYARLRQAFLRKGRLLVEAGTLEDTDQVFFLSPGEIRIAEAGGRLDRPVLDLVGERKEQHAHWQAQPAPDWIIAGPAEQDLASSAPSAPISRPALSGIGSSPGVASGPARVLFDAAQASSLRPGEVLVAPHTDPGWTPLFLSCKAVVTEIGGFLSHGATVAREYGIPCVVNVHGATQQIHTGDWIEVDGTKGQVIIYNTRAKI
ncbi:MAG TPA: PEP-utilizing enzyme, partial [Anaerolineales bacterium]